MYNIYTYIYIFLIELALLYIICALVFVHKTRRYTSLELIKEPKCCITVSLKAMRSIYIILKLINFVSCRVYGRNIF